MRTIILEGTSTAGKTTLADKLVRICKEKGLSYQLIEEAETLMPILNTEDKKTHLEHLEKILKKVFAKKCDVVIFDRFHLTSVARTASSIEEFKEIEAILKKNNTIVVYLYVNKEHLPDRIFKTLEIRDESWAEHVNQIGSRDEIIAHYRGTQDKILSSFEATKLPKIFYDTTAENFDEITDDIIIKYLS